jgi:hypothetical protein
MGDSQAGQRNRRPVRRQRLPEARGNRDKRVTGVIGDESSANQGRTGDDTRKRGWFWHWNSIVTQYAPLIGLKGVGLLNSYTVWTDRREESPYRGYAFPSQQTEAAFYGEDRAELITINKILVALDLIEIRKEMVLRTDEKGRKWRVPHNFYRVKDQGDGFNLTSDAVSRVVALADRDDVVYRYVRRIFSPRFAPIDRNNIWHQILAELRPTGNWQRLAARTERTEKRASARSKAGHAARRAQSDEGGFSLPNDGDSAAPVSPPIVTRNDSIEIANDSENNTDETSVADTNTGSETDVEPPNTGLAAKSESDDAQANTGGPTSVAPSNSMYYQELTTTTGKQHDVRTYTHSSEGQSPPDGMRDEDRAFRQFEEANDRVATRAERRLLRLLAADLAERATLPIGESWRWIADAIDEAVAAGSAFVAPRRIQEIVNRWSREGRTDTFVDKKKGRQSQPRSQPVTRSGNASHRSAESDVTGADGGGHKAERSRANPRTVPAPPRRGDTIRAAMFDVPDSGLTNHQVWSAVVDELQRGGTLPRVDIDAWVKMSAVVGVEDEVLVVGVPNVLAERRAAGRYLTTLEDAVHRVTGIRFEVRIVLRDGRGEDGEQRASGT